jgi:hypothetical protein
VQYVFYLSRIGTWREKGSGIVWEIIIDSRRDPMAMGLDDAVGSVGSVGSVGAYVDPGIRKSPCKVRLREIIWPQFYIE